jgi:hypothetical protein
MITFNSLLEQVRGQEDNARFDSIEIMRDQIDAVIGWLKDAKKAN